MGKRRKSLARLGPGLRVGHFWLQKQRRERGKNFQPFENYPYIQVWKAIVWSLPLCFLSQDVTRHTAQQFVRGRCKHRERRIQLINYDNQQMLAQLEDNSHLLFNFIVFHSVRDFDSTHLKVFRTMSTAPLYSTIVYWFFKLKNEQSPYVSSGMVTYCNIPGI